MPKPKTDPWYGERIAALIEEGWKPGAIYEFVRQEARDRKRDDIPTERTLRRIYVDKKNRPEDERVLAGYAKWPESFSDDGPLPWTAARSVVELIGFCVAERPTVRTARWFWRLREAWPDLDVARGFVLAHSLGVWESDRENVDLPLVIGPAEQGFQGGERIDVALSRLKTSEGLKLFQSQKAVKIAERDPFFAAKLAQNMNNRRVGNNGE